MEHIPTTKLEVPLFGHIFGKDEKSLCFSRYVLTGCLQHYLLSHKMHTVEDS